MEGSAMKTKQSVKGPEDDTLFKRKASGSSSVSSTDGDTTPRTGEDNGDKKKKLVKLEPIFFKLTDKLDKEAVNDYRLKYREFRQGKAFGAHGEIGNETIVASDPVDTIVPPFVAKLTSMLTNSMYSEYVDWSEDGKNVVVKKVAEFSSAILPKYFKHKNFTSFLRQLNMYGFHTARQGKNWREFRNDLFQRDLPKDHCRIKRRKGDDKTGIPNGKGVETKLKKRRKLNDEEQATISQLSTALERSNERVTALEAQILQMHKILEKVQMKVSMLRDTSGKKKPAKKAESGDSNTIWFTVSSR
mmetsp:Transcript_5151/g.5904  ORF Transcript_5151/g.5904 Transcript_5151/m.5904 type:complete len:302 (+) Transcript_5151:343-1248(+)